MEHPTNRATWTSHLTRWAAELLLVFIGAYAAFWLSNMQERQQDVRRHDQILAALENEATAAIKNARQERAKAAHTATEFRRALDEGEMPLVGSMSFASDYSPTDNATLLQSGGYLLLDVQNHHRLRKVETTLRSGLDAITHIERFSDELIAPNLDQDRSFFYDPATKKLRKRFQRYPVFLETIVNFFDDYIPAEKELLRQIRAERQRH